MQREFSDRLRRLSAAPAALRGGQKGIEKESLRVAPDGTIAQTPHPAALGAALTHPYITTDYSEALLELITPPETAVGPVLDFLEDTHGFVYRNLGEEMLWTTSMPCVLEGDRSIPIAEYGSSNSGRMRHVYRRGLAYRYGRVMQVISGVHYNYSLPRSFWPLYQELERRSEPLRDFVDAEYFALIRNVLRHSWLLVYLFGASPAICNSFLGGERERFSKFDDTTRYEPFATSLRMSDIGYTNRSPAGLKVRYDGLEPYVESLGRAIRTPHPPYQRLGLKVDGEYRQLNANILQIENEFYSSVRPKQIAERGEKPTDALRSRGVAYVEIRSLDVDPFAPSGVGPAELRFMEAFLIFCLLGESPPIGDDEQAALNRNLTEVAYRGREPGLELAIGGRRAPLRQHAAAVLEQVAAAAELLEAPGEPYRAAVGAIAGRVEEPDALPSARMLAAMRRESLGFFHYALKLSLEHRDRFRQRPPSAHPFEAWSRESIEAQTALETSDDVSFEEYLASYFADPV